MGLETHATPIPNEQFPANFLDGATPPPKVSPRMPGPFRPLPLKHLGAPLFVLLGLLGCSSSQPPTRPAPKPATKPASASVAARTAPTPAPQRAATTTTPPRVAPPVAPPAPVFPVMLGIDVLESRGFDSVKGKR